MKTREFIKYFEDEGYIVDTNVHTNRCIIVSDEMHGLVFYIFNSDALDTNFAYFIELDHSKKQEYYKVIFEYLMTPPEERKDEKRYHLKQKGTIEKYLVKFDGYFDSVDLYSDLFPEGKTEFTQDEIDELDECYTHPAVWEKELVEEDD